MKSILQSDRRNKLTKKRSSRVRFEVIALALLLLLPLATLISSHDADASSGPSVTYSVHVQNIGWQGWVRNGQMAGTAGQSLRLEAMRINLGNVTAGNGIRYRTHVQNIGWQGWVSTGAISGTSGRSLRLEGLQIELTGPIARTHHVEYRVHVQNMGWQAWMRDGQMAGTSGRSLRLEAMEIRLVPRSSGGGNAPPPVTGSSTVEYRTHVQNVGWQGWVRNGQMAGTSGRSLRLEGIEIRLPSQTVAGNIRYRTHVQNVGWQGWVQNGAMSGTTGRGLRLEGIQIELTGAMATNYHVEYRTHVQNVGWQPWVRDGAMAGTTGRSLRLEGIEIRLIPRRESPGGHDCSLHSTRIFEEVPTRSLFGTGAVGYRQPDGSTVFPGRGKFIDGWIWGCNEAMTETILYLMIVHRYSYSSGVFTAGYWEGHWYPHLRNVQWDVCNICGFRRQRTFPTNPITETIHYTNPFGNLWEL